MEVDLSALVRERAGNCCEYCRLPQEFSSIPFEIDHIIARKHSGKTVLENLALSCFYCNSHKGPNIAGLDSDTGELSRLYHPRQDRWAEHFRWDGAVLVGQTAVGQATIAVLAINSPDRVLLRISLLREVVRQIAELRVDSASAARLAALAEKANEGELSADEQAEYESYIETNNLLAILQAEARLRLGHHEP